ncbi:MAG: hypothetical protein WCN95_12040 [bacterium]
MIRKLAGKTRPAGRMVVHFQLRAWLLALVVSGLQLMLPPVTHSEPKTDSSWYIGRISGQSRTVYDYNSAGDYKDSDIYEYIFLRGTDLAWRHVDFYISGKMHRDLDGTSTSLADDLFAGLDDVSLTMDDYLYQAYIEGHDQAKRLRVRLGRQYVETADSLHIDGGQLMAFENGWLGGRVYFGRPVSYYSSVDGDWAGGLSLIGRPWAENQTRLTYVCYHDESVAVDDERYSLDMRQQLPWSLANRLQVSALNGRFETAGLDLFYAPAESDLDASLGVRRWGGVMGESREYSPLASVLGNREPYTYVRGTVSKSILPWLYISPGVTLRIVEGSEDLNNRDYVRYDLALACEPDKAWSASVAGEYWDVDHGDRFFGVSGEVRYRHAKIWEISAGAGYFRYVYDQYSDFEGTIDAGDVRISGDGTVFESSPDSYSYYMSVKWNVTRAVSLQLRGEIEDNSETEDLSYRGRTSVAVRF